MQTRDRGDIRVTYPDRYRPTTGGLPAPTSRRGLAEETVLPDDTTVEAALDQLFEDARLHVVEEFEFEAEPGRRAVRGDRPEEQTIAVEVDTLAGESAAVLVNKDGVYSWIFPEGLTAARRATRRAAIEQDSTLRFEIPLDSGPSADRGGLFDLGDKAIGWVKAKVLKFAAGAAVGVAMKLLERSVEPGLVLVDGDDPDRWERHENFSQITLPEDRKARILLLVHGTFSSTIGSFRGLAASSWGKRLLADLNDEYDVVVGFDHKTLGDAPDTNADDLLRRIEARTWNHAPVFDAISYSRGGLVLRSLVESLLPHSRLKAEHPTTRLGTGIFVGATNAGTLLAEPENWHNLIDLYTNLAVGAARVMSLLPGGPTVPVLVGEALGGIADFAKYLATEAIDLNGIPGLAAMDPDGDFIRRINRSQPGQPTPSEIAYQAVISDFEPGGGAGGLVGELPKKLMIAAADKLIDQLMGEGNDLVVNTRSMTSVDDPADGYVRDVLDFGQNGKVYHLVYFTQRQIDAAIRQWLRLKAERSVRAGAAPDPIPQFKATLRSAEAAPRRAEVPTGQKVDRPQLDIEVVWDDIKEAPGDVFAVGHYRGVLPQAAELSLDWAVSGDGKDGKDKSHLVLTNMTKRNLLRGEMGDVDFFPWGSRGDRVVAICGMGFQGTFTANSLRSLHRNLAWSVISLPHLREITTVLIGAGTGNLDTREALHGMLAGFADALRSAEGASLLLRIVEFDKRKADEIYDILSDLQANDGATAQRTPVVISLEHRRPRAGDGGRIDDTVCLDALLRAADKAGTNAPFAEVRAKIAKNVPGRRKIIERLDQVALEFKSVPKMIRSLISEETGTTKGRKSDPSAIDRIGFYFYDEQVRASAIASMGPTIPERILRIDPSLLKDAARQMTDPAKDAIPGLGSLLYGLAVPRDFRNFLRSNTNAPLVVEVDRTTAPVHWEMLTDRAAQERVPGDEESLSIGLSRAVARQLRTVYSPAPAWRSGAAGPGLRALVIGDPGDPEKRHNLPGARDEARVVARMLQDADQFEEVHVLIGAPDASGRPSESGFQPATRIDVLRILINEPIDLVHYAGHGDYDLSNPTKTGWLFKDGMLTAGEISRVDRVPPLVIANACLTSQLARRRGANGKMQYDAALLPSLADEFFKRGVLNYLGTAWQIDDRGAVAFTKAFYKRFLDGDTLGGALLAARKELNKREDALWAAYQHYGDPSFTIQEF